MTLEQITRLERLEKEADFVTLINEIKALLKTDRSVFMHPFIKRWCGIRWRSFFLAEAVVDKTALKKADKSKILGLKDKRPAKQKIAERYLRGDEIREWSLDLPEFKLPKKQLNTTLIFSPGLLNGMLPVRAFQSAFPKLEEDLGIRIIRSDNHPMRGCKANVDDLTAAVEQGAGLAANTKEIANDEQQAPKNIVLIGYSKGSPDIYQLLVDRPDLTDRIRCIYNWGGAVGGSYLADDIYTSIKDMSMPKVEKAMASFLALISPAINIKSGVLRRFDEYNIKEAVRDLTTYERSDFLAKNMAYLSSLDIPVFNITGSTSAMEVPYFQIQGVMEINRYDLNNDMQLTQAQAKLKTPMATDLAMLRAHHWDMSYDPFPKLMRFGSPNLDHPFPKEAAVKAMVMLAIELGLID
tara:strand:+ start:41921 stop:43150 length:1230 start_codon:yes stop_codon:yes gene_type:complete